MTIIPSNTPSLQTRLIKGILYSRTYSATTNQWTQWQPTEKQIEIEKAYGLLSMNMTPSTSIHKAMSILSSLIDEEGKKRGIIYASSNYSNLTDRKEKHPLTT